MGAGKSTSAMNLARAWALGVPFLGRQCRQSKTLVVVSPKEFEAWAETVGFWGLKGLIYLVESNKAHFGDREAAVQWFDYLMGKDQCRTFVLDTLFDFFGMPPNTSGDSNRIVMNEQTPLLQLVRERNYSGLVTGHAPKSEAHAVDPRDPEEAFAGHTAWTAQHRMRMTLRRKSQGVNAFVTGRGGYGDKGILKEELLKFDEKTRLVSLGGLFSDHLGQAAMSSVVECLEQLGQLASISQLEKEMGRGHRWIRPGLREGGKKGLVIVEGKAKNTKYRRSTPAEEEAAMRAAKAAKATLFDGAVDDPNGMPWSK
jgi:AAA domain